MTRVTTPAIVGETVHQLAADRHATGSRLRDRAATAPL